MSCLSKRGKQQEITYEDVYGNILDELKSMDLPALTLDSRWLELFYNKKTKEMEKLEKEVNKALKEQGKINDEKRELTQLKQTLLQKIVDNMEADVNSRGAKKVAKSKELVEDINNKLIMVEDRQLSLPDKMRDSNARLMMETLRVLCERTVKNKKEIDELTQYIDATHQELKTKIAMRADMLEENENIYKYLNKCVDRDIVRKYEYMLDEFGEK